MIYLHTGLPGAGKTLNTLVEVRARALKEKRPVFYSGINDLRLPGWAEFGESTNPDAPHLTDPSKWYELPHKSIIVIDECQRLWRQRHYGTAVPEFVSKLETHRHHGWDLHLITQDPRLLDTNLRRLVGRHIHYVRTLGGANAVSRHEWNEIREDVQARGDSTMTLVPYDKEAFKWYKSAEVHTHKIRIPSRVYVLLAIPALFIACGWVAWHFLSARIAPKEAKAAPGQAQVAPGASAPAPGASLNSNPPGKGGTQVLTAAQYVAQYVPRIPGLPHTAPVYDPVTAPKVAPRPAACLRMRERCECFTQQATRLTVPQELCEQIVVRGYFQEWHDETAPNAEYRGQGAGLPAAWQGIRPSLAAPPEPPRQITRDDEPPRPAAFIRARGYEPKS